MAVITFFLLPIAAFASPVAPLSKFLRGARSAGELQDVSLTQLPPCPAQIYQNKFCSHADLAGGGAACVSSVDAMITMAGDVQCVPFANHPDSYTCPMALPVKCDACQALGEPELTENSQAIQALCAGIGGSCPAFPYQVNDIYGIVGEEGGAIDGRGLDCSKNTSQPCIAFAFVTLPEDVEKMINDEVGCSGTDASNAICTINNFVGIPPGTYSKQSYTMFRGKVTNQTANTSSDKPVDIIVPTWEQLGKQYFNILDFVFGRDERLRQCGTSVNSSVFETLQNFTEGMKQFDHGFAELYTQHGQVMEEFGGECSRPGDVITDHSNETQIKLWGSTCQLMGDNSKQAFLAKTTPDQGLCNSVGVARMVLWIYGDCNQEFLGTGSNPGGKEGIVLPNQNVPRAAATLPLGDAECEGESPKVYLGHRR